MASPRKPPKQSSGWGGFLQQAVLSVESKLDTILADDDQPSTKTTSTSTATQEAVRRASADISRSSSAAKNNDRLQERLARAMAKKKSEGRNDSPASSRDGASTAGALVEDSLEELGQASTTRTSSESVSKKIDVAPSIAVDDTSTASGLVGQANRKSLLSDPGSLENYSESPALSQAGTPFRLSSDEDRHSLIPNIVVNGVKAPLGGASAEEMYSYIEKIDALQAKLQYLTKEAAASARDAAAVANAGSVERKLLEKDEQIALLIEEGQKLSKTEMKHLAIIKKLRSQAAENAKTQASVKVRTEKAEANLSGAEQRVTRAESAMRRAEENLETSLNADRDLDALRNERDALTATIAEIRSQLAYASRRAENAESKAQEDALGKEKKQTADLLDDLTSARVEREICEEKLRREIRDLKSSLTSEKERSRSLEGELRAEQSLLESKMESLRNRAEEASSSSVGDSQAKLLRQIETLQNQYVVASENWQGIESSLLARIADVEKERDALENREVDLRKKNREAVLKIKHAEKEIGTSNDAVYQLEQSLSELKSEAQRLWRKLKETEDSLVNTKRDLETYKNDAEAELSRRLEEEKNRWKEHNVVASPTLHRNESPINSMRKGSGLGLGFEHITGSMSTDRPQSRRSSALPYSTPPRQNSSASIQPSTNGVIPEGPSPPLIDQDDYFPEPPTPASLGAHRGVNDLMSVSTVAAGPSVQLVERMSASVRRLESEKAISKDELARLTAQRDESRKEVVTMMREVEQKRANDEKIKALKEELRLVNARHETTLEMLGEKSELVEELKADVADVKQMYRDLVDSTMK